MKKTMTALATAAALIAGISIASAQNPGGKAEPNGSPSNLNTSTTTSSQSGSEKSSTAMKSGSNMNHKNFAGNGKFCMEVSPGTAWKCNYASLEACQKEGKPNNRQCEPNPKMGTTGSK